MTAYGAVISLKNTIEHILHSSHFSLVCPSLKIIQRAYNELQPLQEILEILDNTRKSKSRKMVNALDGKIKDEIWKLEDLLESLLIDQILPQFEISGNVIQARRRFNITRILCEPQLESLASSSRNRNGGERSRNVFLFVIDLRRLKDDVDSFIHALKDLKMEYIYELENMAEDDEDESASSVVGFCGTNSKMIGLSDQFEQMKIHLMGHYSCTLIGMAGIGKTALAKKIFEDQRIISHFECRAWVTVGRVPQQLTKLSQGILAQLCGTQHSEGDEILSDDLKEMLKDKNCLIVLDDVWETDVLNSLISSLPRIIRIYVRILVTARERNVVENLVVSVVVRFLDQEESKKLLCETVFGDKDLCPDELDKAVTKIAKKCEGLPLTIVTVADILSNSQNREPDYWDDVAEDRNSVFLDAYNRITKVLYPSYNYLPQYLKMPFLYMGVFPPDYDFPPSKLINMFTGEGWFLNTTERQVLEESVSGCLEELCYYKHLVLFNRKSICLKDERLLPGTYKNCRLHSSWRHVCRGEASKNKFYHVLNKLVDGSEEWVKGLSCLCLQNNILFGIKEFCDSVRSNCASSIRSLLFMGPYHQYPIPIDVGFMLLRELDALNLRFYTFPTEILTLVLLKYLALTCNGELPRTMSKLFNLRVLIIHPHMRIRRCRAPSYVPMEIWDMQELEHIEILGKSLVAPFPISSLENLSTLVGVNASICTILELSKRIPNIRKLGVQIELTPYDDHNNLLSCFGCISKLASLEILKCSIINPVMKYAYVVPATPCPLMLPRGLKKLHLSGMGFPWEYIDIIGCLPCLQVLKLRSYAFRGPRWAHEGGFLSLEFLLIEDSDLMYLNTGYRGFPMLSYLSMRHCYKIQEIHNASPIFMNRKIELVDCNPLALTSAKHLQLARGTRLDIIVSSSFEEKPITIKLERHG